MNENKICTTNEADIELQHELEKGFFESINNQIDKELLARLRKITAEISIINEARKVVEDYGYIITDVDFQCGESLETLRFNAELAKVKLYIANLEEELKIIDTH